MDMYIIHTMHHKMRPRFQWEMFIYVFMILGIQEKLEKLSVNGRTLMRK